MHEQNIEETKKELNRQLERIDELLFYVGDDDHIRLMDDLKTNIRKLTESKPTETNTTDIGELKKSVEELKPLMGDAFNDLSVQVAFKEGYNKAVDALAPHLQQSKSSELRGFVNWVFDLRDTEESDPLQLDMLKRNIKNLSDEYLKSKQLSNSSEGKE